MKVITDPNKIEKVLTRGVEAIFPNKEYLKARLESGERLTIYNGIDPTGPTLHIGHGIVIRKLAEFQKLGHEVIFLIGDFTAMIGDPTDKSAARVVQTPEEVQDNLKLYKEQASHFIKFDGENPAGFRLNSEWWNKMSYADGLKLATNFTHSQMIKRDMFQKRIEEGKDLYMHELNYPMMQGYDSVVMDVDGEIGGNDQTFNMLAGRDLMKKLKNKDKFVLAMKLLVDPTGKKMGKTEGNMVAFTDSPTEMYGKIMSWPDTLMPLAYELCTDIDMPEGDPKETKLNLAKNIVSTYFGDDIGDSAQAEWVSTFSKGEAPTDIPGVKPQEGALLADVLLEHKLVASKSEFRRLINEGAISLDGEKIGDYNQKAPPAGGVVRVGKHRFLKLV